ncbi:hypothetical protein GCM10007304_19180 [Rhodococcoides trifolii]|uniref:Uncharacterized protein n=1 Tax=Rhodococcoides trifolii TaxID=908250 RepID=A0A917D0Y0_9NOCA|nr:hypothetical protein GCM10007304_19180 [Rhodococcus trifolii]
MDYDSVERRFEPDLHGADELAADHPPHTFSAAIFLDLHVETGKPPTPSAPFTENLRNHFSRGRHEGLVGNLNAAHAASFTHCRLCESGQG